MGASMVLALAFVYLVARTLGAMPEGYVVLDSVPDRQKMFQDTTVLESTPPQQVAGTWNEPNSLAWSTSQKQLKLHDENPDDTHQIGHLLFTKYLAPFEVTSLLILVATIGVIVLCKQEERT